MSGRCESRKRHFRVLWWYVGVGTSWVRCSSCSHRHYYGMNSNGTYPVRTLLHIGLFCVSYCRLYHGPWGRRRLYDKA